MEFANKQRFAAYEAFESMHGISKLQRKQLVIMGEKRSFSSQFVILNLNSV